MRAVPVVLAAALVAAGCVPTPVAPPDRDAGSKLIPDAGDGSRDAGDLEAGVRDAGPSAPHDGGFGPDASAPDATPMADRDNDGIPDDEDPMPDQPNALLFADTFEDTTGGWLFSSVSMGIRESESQLAVRVLEPFEREGWIGPQPAWGDYLIRTLIRIGRVGTSNSVQSGHAGVIARVSQVTPSRYITCGVDLKSDRIVLAEHVGTMRTTLASTDVELNEGDWLLIDFVATNSSYSCKVGGVELTASSGTFFAGSVGFRSYDATFAADWIEVYEIF